ncbi:MAG: ATP-dependent DNA helicase RecG [Anaerolineales bacterium]
MIEPCLVKLQKIFKLESERGYDNRAVVGGLEKLATSWEAEARADGLPEELLQAVVSRLRDYHRLSEPSRQEALQGLWKRIQRVTGESSGGEGSARPQRVAASPKGKSTSPKPPTKAPEVAALAQDAAPPEERPEPVVNPPSPAAESRPNLPPAALATSVTAIDGVGSRHAETLGRLGIRTLGDLLYYLPRRYDDYSAMKPIQRLNYGEEVTVIGTVQQVTTRPVQGGKAKVTEAILSDGTAALRLTWFNQPWVAQRLRDEASVVVSGKVEQYLGRLVMNNPEWEPLEQQQLHTNRIVPVYPLTAKITQRWLRRLIHEVVSFWAGRVPDPLPEAVRSAAAVLPLPQALLQVHFPDSQEMLQAARARLAFDEIFLLQLGVQQQKRAWQNRAGRQFTVTEAWLGEQLARLPYVLTGAQQRALADLRADLASGQPMNRLLQGDVGSGKTVIAALAMAMVVEQGAQAALMAPTSILAEQHLKNVRRTLCGEGGFLPESAVRLLVGATGEAERREILEGLMTGEVKILVGTHALVEQPVVFRDLQLAVIDEQHRFGVEQRAALREKGENPHLLVTTATPIPRSLALTIYGDLDLTVMDELPPGRQVIGTHVLYPRERERAYQLIRSQVAQGRQAFIIYPLVEEREKSDSKAAVEEQARLQAEVFPRLRVGLLHGRMKPDEKDAVMASFRDGAFDVLVATTVVEVGVDVPNATVMLIEGANRFGLAQLHQLRGRVGRGEHQSFCLLIPEKPDAVENERLKAMAETNDGFVLAERDLAQRGPGHFLGTRQSGFGDLRFANLTDVHLIEKARRHAQAVFAQDPDLSAPEFALLREHLDRFWQRTPGGDVS